MTENEADELAMLLSQTWSYSPTPDIWAEELRELDAMRARETYRRLRREAKKAPSIAEFLAAYRSLAGTDKRTESRCVRCDDTGFVTCTDHPAHWRSPRPMPVDDRFPDDCTCNIATWCPHCPEGDRARMRLKDIDRQRPPDPEPHNPAPARWPAA